MGINLAFRRSFATTTQATSTNPLLQRNYNEENENEEDNEDIADEDIETLSPPDSPAFYTGRNVFYDCVSSLERAVHHSRIALKTAHLYPLPDFARNSLPPLPTAWKSKEGLSASLPANLSASRHRRLLQLLNQLHQFRRIATAASHIELVSTLDDLLDVFERSDKEQHLRRGQRKPVIPDEFGRTYTLGKRKTSSARVWMISSEHAQKSKTDGNEPTVPITQILVNNVPLNEYFKIPIDREKILRPFRLTGLLGAYNVFSIVRGGGITGQAGAVAHGIAKGLAAHVPDVELILRRCRLFNYLHLL